MMLAGLTSSGTQGAVEFATSSSKVAELLNLLFRDGPPSLFEAVLEVFEAVLEVQVVQGLDPISVHRVAARRLGE